MAGLWLWYVGGGDDGGDGGAGECPGDGGSGGGWFCRWYWECQPSHLLNVEERLTMGSVIGRRGCGTLCHCCLKRARRATQKMMLETMTQAMMMMTTITAVLPVSNESAAAKGRSANAGRSRKGIAMVSESEEGRRQK